MLLLKTFHWLPTGTKVKCKLLTRAYQALCDLDPACLCSLPFSHSPHVLCSPVTLAFSCPSDTLDSCPSEGLCTYLSHWWEHLPMGHLGLNSNVSSSEKPSLTTLIKVSPQVNLYCITLFIFFMVLISPSNDHVYLFMCLSSLSPTKT